MGRLARPDAAAAAQLTLLVIGELTCLHAWNQSLGLATRLPTTLIPLILLLLVFLLSAVARHLTHLFIRPSLAPTTLRLTALTLSLLTTELTWLLGSPTPFPLSSSWLPLTNDTLLLRGLAAGALVWFAWWRGAALPYPTPTLFRVESAFRVWMQALGALFILTAAVRDVFSPILPSLVAIAILPLGAGLIGMPLARVFDIRRERDPDGRVPTRVGGQWAWIIGSSVTALLVSALLLSRALVAGILTTLMRWLGGPASLVGQAIDSLLLSVAGLWSLLMRSTAEEGIGVDDPGFSPARGVPDQTPVARAAAGELDWLMSIASATATALLLLLLWQLLTRAKQRLRLRVADDGVEEERDFVWPSLDGSFGLDTLSGLLARLRRRRITRRLGSRAAQTPAERVRRLYRRLLQVGEKTGHPRNPDETPREYQRALHNVPHFTPASDDLETLTTLYSQVRYGETSPAPNALTAGEQAMRRLRSRPLRTPRPG